MFGSVEEQGMTMPYYPERSGFPRVGWTSLEWTGAPCICWLVGPNEWISSPRTTEGILSLTIFLTILVKNKVDSGGSQFYDSKSLKYIGYAHLVNSRINSLGFMAFLPAFGTPEWWQKIFSNMSGMSYQIMIQIKNNINFSLQPKCGDTVPWYRKLIHKFGRNVGNLQMSRGKQSYDWSCNI